MGRLIAALLLLTMVRIALGAEDRSAEYSRYKQRREIQAHLYGAGFYRFGNQLRAGAILDACGQKGLAMSLGPSTGEVISFLVDEMKRADGWGDKSRAFMDGLTGAEAIELAIGVSEALLVGYRSGYLDLAKAVKNHEPLCGAGLKMADELLKERYAK